MSDGYQAATAYHKNLFAILAKANAKTDIWVVTDRDLERGTILARPAVASGPGLPTPALKGVQCDAGDEVIVLKVAGRWIILGAFAMEGHPPS